MQLPIIPFRGQSKPWGSIPRINRGHPLARGLVSYVYDCGGVYIDLIGGAMGKVQTAGGGASLINGQTAFGGGIEYANTGNDVFIFMPPNAALIPVTSNPFTIAYGLYPRTLPSSNEVLVLFDGSKTWLEIQAGPFTAGGQFMLYALGGVASPERYSTNGLMVANKFNSWVMTATDANDGVIFFNGLVDGSFTGTPATNTSNPTQLQWVFNSNLTSSTGFSQGGLGTCNLFYAGAWDRPLSAQEAWLLHQGPYGFLIYPEDEMFAEWVGASAAGFTWSQTGEEAHRIPLRLWLREVERHD